MMSLNIYHILNNEILGKTEIGLQDNVSLILVLIR